MVYCTIPEEYLQQLPPFGTKGSSFDGIKINVAIVMVFINTRGEDKPLCKLDD